MANRTYKRVSRESLCKTAKIAGSNPKPLLQDRRMPIDAHRPFTVTWEGVILVKMLFEDCPVGHDPHQQEYPIPEGVHPRLGDQGRHARAERVHLPGRSSKPWQLDRITQCVPTPFGGIEEDDKHGPLSVWLSTSSVLSLSLFVSFIESLCDIKLVVGQGTRTFVFFCLSHVDWRACASSGQAQSPLIDVSTIVASSSRRTFPFASLAGLVQRLISCFML